MKNIICLALVLACLTGHCQNTKEDFLNEVAPDLFRFHGKYQLWDDAPNIWSYHRDKTEVSKTLFTNVPCLDELYEAARDTTTYYWDFGNLSRAQKVKAIERRKKIILIHREAKTNYVTVSAPVFNKSKDWAIVSVHGWSTGVGRGYAYGSIFVFHKVDGIWKLMEETAQWMS